MTTKQLIRDLGIQHLTAKDVQRIEEALNSADLETMLAVTDDLVGKAGSQKHHRTSTFNSKHTRGDV